MGSLWGSPTCAERQQHVGHRRTVTSEWKRIQYLGTARLGPKGEGVLQVHMAQTSPWFQRAV